MTLNQGKHCLLEINTIDRASGKRFVINKVPKNACMILHLSEL